MHFHHTDDGETDFLKGLVAGVAGGLLASFLMEQFQAAWGAATEAMQEKKHRGRKPQPTTVKVANALSKKIAGRKVPKGYQAAAGEAVHYGVGAGSAGIYGALAEIAPIITAGEGLAFGAGVWIMADEIAVSAAGFSQWPREIPLTTHIYALASHLVYGWITETVRRAVRATL